MSPQFKLRFHPAQIVDCASRYSYQDDARVENVIGPRSKAHGHLTGEDFRELCAWKSARPKGHCARNSDVDIKAVTTIALTTSDEELRVNVLMALHGVEMRTASAILHFCGKDRYPILDIRALWSLGVEEAPKWYGFNLWWSYTEFCRQLADDARVSMRTLDRALWQYSEEQQR